MSDKIKAIKAKEILDSRGIPTIEVELKTDSGNFSASVPSGTSKGKYEAVELRDEDNKGVSKAVKNIQELIAPVLKGKDVTCQQEIDNLMIKLDGTENKSKLGANAILAVSIAVCRAGAAAKKVPLFEYISQVTKTSPLLPSPSVLLIEGGKHAKNKLAFQEFMIVAEGKSFKEKFDLSKTIYKKLGKILKNKTMGMEGGFDAGFGSIEQALDLIVKAISDNKAKIALDVAANSFYSEGIYKFEGKDFNREELSDFYLELLQKYPIISFEDPFAEEDWEAWKSLKIESLIVGDDLTVTNKERVRKALQEKCIGGIIVKPNQIGTVTETLECVKAARDGGLKIIVSHRSGDTKDDFIADLATGIGADFIKTGGPTKPERLAKYNRLLEIEEEFLS